MWEANVNLKTGQLVTKGEWGTLMSNPSSPRFHRDCLDQYIKQLKYFLKNNRSPNPKLTATDLKGYKIIRDANSENIAKTFFELKAEDREKWVKEGAERKFETNIDVINYMKKEGLWKK